jgi:hypothetical protein
MSCYAHLTTTLGAVIDQAKVLPDARQQKLAEIILMLRGQDGQMPVIVF